MHPYTVSLLCLFPGSYILNILQINPLSPIYTCPNHLSGLSNFISQSFGLCCTSDDLMLDIFQYCPCQGEPQYSQLYHLSPAFFMPLSQNHTTQLVSPLCCKPFLRPLLPSFISPYTHPAWTASFISLPHSVFSWTLHPKSLKLCTFGTSRCSFMVPLVSHSFTHKHYLSMVDCQSSSFKCTIPLQFLFHLFPVFTLDQNVISEHHSPQGFLPDLIRVD